MCHSHFMYIEKKHVNFLFFHKPFIILYFIEAMSKLKRVFYSNLYTDQLFYFKNFPRLFIKSFFLRKNKIYQ